MNRLWLTAPILAATLIVSACGRDSGPGEIVDVGPPTEPVGALPGVPPPDGEVWGVGTVLDEGDGAELCLGPVAESWPPQCSGIPLEGWDWASVDASGAAYEHSGDVRWGEFTVTGSYDGTGLSVTDVGPRPVPADPADPDDLVPSAPASPVPTEDLDAIAEELGTADGVLTAYVNHGRVQVDVLFDDGTIQAWADGRYGADVVWIWSSLHSSVDPTM